MTNELNRRTVLQVIGLSTLVGNLSFLQATDTNSDPEVTMRMYLELLKIKSAKGQNPEPNHDHAVTKPTVPKAKAAIKTVEVYFAPFHCPPCEQLKRDIKGWDAPFVLTYPKIHSGIPSYPHLRWLDGSGKPQNQSGWSGRDAFLKVWLSRETQGLKAPESKSQLLKLSGPKLTQNDYNPIMTWPGNLSNHLTDDHHVSVNGLSTDQMEMLHDSLHNWGHGHASGGKHEKGR